LKKLREDEGNGRKINGLPLVFLLYRTSGVFKGGEENICFDKIIKMPLLMARVSSSLIYLIFSTLVKPFQTPIDMTI
jgi:hypothetical protein